MCSANSDDEGQPVYGFRHHGRSWFATASPREGCLDYVSFGLTDRAGGYVGGELLLEWTDLTTPVTTHFTAYSDSWVLFAHPPVAAFLRSLARVNGPGISADQVCALLLAAGFVDLTEASPPEP